MTVQLDSTLRAYQALKSDYNNLEYELSESERYASFSDYELAKKLDQDRIETQRLTNELKVARREAVYTSWISQKRADAFAADAHCVLDTLSDQLFVLQKQNSVFIDTESLIQLSKDNPQQFKTVLIQLVQPLKGQKGWQLNICLNVADLATDWHKINMQNEMMAFFASEAGLPSSQLSSITRIASQQKSPEFGFSTNSRLLVEIEFKG